ncbi:MAG: GTPase HflX [Spirochaetes bacterium]|nr:GTPase HflX [Spirochaetota bacterium]
MHTVPDENRRAFLVGVERKPVRTAHGLHGSHLTDWSVQDSLVELARLADTAGLRVVGSTWQKLDRPDPGTYVGSGKVHEVHEAAVAENAGYVLFDDELSPGQQRKLEKELGAGVRLLDRTRLILDIFSLHAHSREGKLQVELAQNEYLLPRLTGLRADLAQQTGGAGAGPVGVRGPGETQLELDRRQVRRRIQKLHAELEEVRSQRRQGRAKRNRTGMPMVALVGYTNAGKSSLLNALTGAGVLVQDKLFSTLDPTIRRLKLPSGREVLLADTVGFIRKLPHALVAAFRATLEGIDEAQLLLHLVDASHAAGSEQIRAVETVLGEIGVLDRPRLLAWNKIDLPAAGPAPRRPPGGSPEEVRISARTGDGLGELLAKIDAMIGSPYATVEALVPYESFELVRLSHERGAVQEREDTAEGVRIRATVPDDLADRLRAFPLPRAKPPRAASAKRTAAPGRAPARKTAGKPARKTARKPAARSVEKPARRPARKPAPKPARKPSAAKRTRKLAGVKPRPAAKRRRSPRS